LFKGTTKDRVALSKITNVVIGASHVGVSTTSHVVTSVSGTSVVIVTEQNLGEDTSSGIGTSIRSTNRAIVTNNSFRPIAMVGSRWRVKQTLVNGTSLSIITVSSSDASWTKIWTVLGGIRGTSLLSSVVVRELTWGSSITGVLENLVVTRLGIVETITKCPIGPLVDTRFRTTVDFERRTRLSPVGGISEWASSSSSNLGSGDVVSHSVISSKSIRSTVTWTSGVASNAVNWGTRWTSEVIIESSTTRNSITCGWGGNVSGSGLVFSSTESTSCGRPGSPISHHAVNRTASSVTGLSIIGNSRTVSSSVHSGLVDGSGASLVSKSTGDRTGGPSSPIAIGTRDWWTGRTVRKRTLTSSNIAIVGLTPIDKSGTILSGKDTTSISSVSSVVTDRDGTQIRWWACNSRGKIGSSASNSVVTISCLTNVSTVTVQTASPVTMVSTINRLEDTSINGTRKFVVTISGIDARWA
jgi:hypothetical protein